LSSSATEDENMNASSIIVELLDIKEFYAVACKRENLE
jgi:hypothetical protein